jgi:eukaryotic-like serine/threonine-protein kinase
MPPTTDLENLRAGDSVNGWRILNPWHQDSWSVFFVVEHQEERRLLRLTRLRPDSPEGREQERLLEREASALRFIQHPSILRVHEDGRWPEADTGHRYLVLDFIEGDILSRWARSGATFTQLLRLVHRLSDILRDMHARGLVHGDLHSENILVRKADEEPILFNFTYAAWPGHPLQEGRFEPSEKEDRDSLDWLFSPHRQLRREGLRGIRRPPE